MAVFNYQRKEIDAKIVYYGPGISGKTTNLQQIHQHLKPDQRGKLVSLATDEDRTLFFDFLPIELESVRGFRTRFHLYTVPGQVIYAATRRAVLTGVDGVVFVADSQADRLEDNLLSLKDLEENLLYYGKKIETIPLIIQYNKRDLPNVLPTGELNQKLNRWNLPYFESVAILGRGVFETLTMSCRLVLKAIETGTEARRSSVANGPDSLSGRSPLTGKGIFPPEAERLNTGPSARIRPDQSSAEIPSPAKKAAARRMEDEPRKTGSRTLLGRMFEKKRAEPAAKIPPEPFEEIAPEEAKFRIVSCGQPHVSSPHSLEIPLTLEVGTLGETLPLNIRISVQLEDPEKVD